MFWRLMHFYTYLLLLGGSPHLSCKRDQIKMRDNMNGRVTPPKRVTSPTWGPPPPSKLGLNLIHYQNHHLTGQFLDGMYSTMFFPLIRRPSIITSHTATLISPEYP